MNKIITTHVLYRGSQIAVEQLKEQSQIKVEVECVHGRRVVRWCRRNQLCKQCAAAQGLFNTSPKGRQITWGDKISKAKKNIKLSERHRKALSISHYGIEKEEEWPGFYNKSEIHRLRDSIEYRNFVHCIMKRDNFACRLTGMRGKLNVHHIESININLEKALDPTNVITLHASVHKIFHDIYGRGNNTRTQFNEFIRMLKLESENA